MKAIVTGAAGFIGSHLVDELIESGWSVLGIDNLSAGKLDNLSQVRANPRFHFKKFDLRKPITANIAGKSDAVFHFAADPEVRTGVDNPESQFDNNILVTYNVLEFLRKTEVAKLYFASSSTVYGEPKTIPTPESYSPLEPISIYGCAKLACETMILGYAQTFGFTAVILRPANVVGERATHGVVLDFLAMLQKNPKKLRILGNGKQSKSYVHPRDVARAVRLIEDNSKRLGQIEVFNIGNLEKTSVERIARIVTEEMRLSPQVEYTGGIEGGRAWKGDVRTVLLSVEKLMRLGWQSGQTSDETVRLAVKELLGGL